MGCTNCSFSKINSDKDDYNISADIFGCSTSYDWLEDLPDSQDHSNLIEARFKNNRKAFFKNTSKLKLTYNDLISVQVPRGFDVGIVSLKGMLAEKQFKRKSPNMDLETLGTVFRKATESDIQTWKEGKAKEHVTMVKTREIVQELKLDMKVSDVEYQGDNKKVTVYYIADNRIDFRQLIKILAKEFKVNIEMRQIGARQETAKLGGIGSCGKELCCSSWRTKLDTVSSNAIHTQHLSYNIEKYTGQCGKLKCCLMYELDVYLEANADFPKELLELETKKGIATPSKIDVLQKTVWYTLKSGAASDPLIEVPLERVKEIINLNKRGVKVESLV